MDGSGDPIPDGSPPVHDQAQGDEGGPNDAVPVELLRCSLCRGTIPVSTGTDGVRRARNDWQKPAAATA